MSAASRLKKLRLSENVEDNSADKIVVQTPDGELNYVNATNLPISTAAQTALDLKEVITNKSDSYTDSSSTTYASTKALVDGLDTRTTYDELTQETRLNMGNTPLFCWGDSLTAGAGGGGTTYPSVLTTLTNYQITNKGVGGETSTQIKDRLIADTANYTKSVIIWAGRNNFTSPATVKADIATMVAALGHTRYFVLSILNADEADEWIGGVDYNTLITLNNDLKTIYGEKYIDIRSHLVSLQNGSAQDLIDFTHDMIPTSLRSDHIHLNATGYTKVAEYLNGKLGILLNSTTFLQAKDIPYYAIRKGTTIADNYVPRAREGGSVMYNSMIYAGDDYVGIGTNNPQAKLDVNGSIRAINDNPIEWGSGAVGMVGNTTIKRLSIFVWDGTAKKNRLTATNSGAILINTETDNSTDNLQIAGSQTSTGQIKSTLATGTSPFAVTSTTVNTNLNADLLDGQHGSYYAPLASPTLTGTPTAPTATSGTNTTQIATTAFVQAAAYGNTFTPTITDGYNSSGAFLDRASYIKIGNLVTATYSINATSTSSSLFTNVIATLPFVRANSTVLNVGSGTAASGAGTLHPARAQCQNDTTVNIIFNSLTTTLCGAVVTIQYSVLE